MVSLGAGGAALFGLGGGLAGGAGATSTVATFIGFVSQLGVTIDDCSRGGDASCMVNVFSTVFGVASFGLGSAAGHLAKVLHAFAESFGTYAWIASAASFLWGWPGAGGYLDRQGC